MEQGKTKQKSRNKRIIRFLATMGLTILMFFALGQVIVPPKSVAGTSMEDTLMPGAVFLSYRTSNIQRGDIITFLESDSGKTMVKRVIGIPGDVIDTDEDGNVYINDHMVIEPYVKDKSLGTYDITFPVFVTADSYFVLGDHRSVSTDSRISRIGLVSKERIQGRVFLKIWPMREIGLIKAGE